MNKHHHNDKNAMRQIPIIGHKNGLTVTMPLFTSLMLLSAMPVMAQEPNLDQPAPSSNTGAPDNQTQENTGDSTEQAKKALQQKETDVSRAANLDEVLRNSERTYGLVKQGQWDLLYEFTYQLYSQDLVNQNLGNPLPINAEHNFMNDVWVDYGLPRNVSVGVNLPVVSKYNANTHDSINRQGDVQARVRWQPWPTRPTQTNLTFISTLIAPTGKSPYKVDYDELSTGQGFYSLSAGVNLSKVIDPVAVFGGISYTHSFDTNNLSQDQVVNCSDGNGGVTTCSASLDKVKPGDSGTLDLGLTVALSYDVSLIFQYQQTFISKYNYYLKDIGGTDTSAKFSSRTANPAILLIGTAWRLSPENVMNVSVGIGQTDDAPDVLLSVQIPIPAHKAGT